MDKGESLASNFVAAGNPVSLTVYDAVHQLRRRLGFDAIQSPKDQTEIKGKLFIHDLMHILADATSGKPSDEERAGIVECQLLPFTLMEAAIENRRLVPSAGTAKKVSEIPNYPVSVGREMGMRYSTEGSRILEKKIESLERELLFECDADPKTNSEIQGLKDLLSDGTLSDADAGISAARGSMIDAFFRATHHGNRLNAFSFTDISAMNLGEFGVQPFKTGRDVRYALTPELQNNF